MEKQRIRKFVNTPDSLTIQTQAILFTLRINTREILHEGIRIQRRVYNYYYHYGFNKQEELDKLLSRFSTAGVFYVPVAVISGVETIFEAIILVKVTPQHIQYINRGVSENVKRAITRLRM